MNPPFYITSAVAVISTLMVITRANAVHALLYLIVSLLSVALIFFMLGAPFVAALEVIIYAGAIMVLFVFIIMMLNLGTQSTRQEKDWLKLESWAGPMALSAILLAELIYMLAGSKRTIAVKTVGPKEVGLSLFGPYLIAVELASFLLLAGIIGAYYLGRQERHKGG